MSKKVKCPSCDMPGDPEGDDYSLVTTYRGRPVLQCFWCDSHILLRKIGGAVVLDLNHKAIRHLRADLEHDEMVSLLLEEEQELEDIAVIASEAPPVLEPTPMLQAEVVEPVTKPASKPRRARRPVAERPPALELGEFEPAMLAEAEAPVVDNTPVLLRPAGDGPQTPIGTETELVGSIPLNARALDHDSLIHIAAQVGWIYTPVRKVPEWMNFELPPPPVLSPLRAKLQSTINMIKYFRINAGTREQRRAETLARRARLVEYRRRMFGEKLEALNAMQAIEYKPKAV